MPIMLLHWSEAGNKHVSSVHEMDLTLDQVHAEATRTQPVIVYAVHPNGDCLAIGLGLPDTILSFIPQSSKTPNLASTGHIAESGVISFYTYDHHSEFPRSQCIPLATGRSALREFFLTGKPPSQITWQEI